MTRVWPLARRALVSLVALWVIVSIAFAFVAVTGDPNEGAVKFAVAAAAAEDGANASEIKRKVRQALETYRSARNYDEPITERYVAWLVDVATLDLGYSFEYGRPVTAVLSDRLAITMVYALPGLAIAVVGGVVVGTYAGIGRNRRLARIASATAYAVRGIPNFWIAGVAISFVTWQLLVPWLNGYDPKAGLWAVENLRQMILPALLLGTSLLANQAQYVRSEVIELEREEFVTLARSKGVTELGVARQVLRVAAPTLLVLFVSNLLETFVLTIVVLEFVFDIPGFGATALAAIRARDLPLIIGVTLVVAAVGIVGNFLGDVVHARLDPRVDLGD